PATDETYTLENSAPEISGVTLLSPTGTITDTQPTFSWTAATDTGSGVVSYTLQLILGSDIQEFSVTGTSYTPTTGLAAGEYTWTVKTHDATGNVSEFVSPAASFSLEPSSSSDNQVYLPIVITD
ncbi:MAG TPA: Ig-like domain-containing protein, partial [Anaerolineae bacterium]